MNKKIIEIDEEAIEAINEANISADMEFLNYEEDIVNINNSMTQYKTTLAKDLLSKKPDIINEIRTKNIEYNNMRKSFLYKIKKLLNLN
jgi:hypothetical protein